MSMNEAVIEKLRKVLALANGRGATQGEIESAMARAKEIALKYDINLASVTPAEAKAAGPTVAVKDTFGIGTAFERKFHPPIYHVLRTVFDIRFVRCTKRQGSRIKIDALYIFGAPSDVAIAKEMFGWLEDLFPKAYRKLVNDGGLFEDASTAHGFYQGLATGIIEANTKAKAAALKEAKVDPNRYAMVVHNKEQAVTALIQKDFPKLRAALGGARDVSGAAHQMGQERGRQINLRGQVGGAAGRGQIN